MVDDLHLLKVCIRDNCVKNVFFCVFKGRLFTFSSNNWIISFCLCKFLTLTFFLIIFKFIFNYNSATANPLSQWTKFIFLWANTTINGREEIKIFVFDINFIIHSASFPFISYYLLCLYKESPENEICFSFLLLFLKLSELSRW